MRGVSAFLTRSGAFAIATALLLFGVGEYLRVCLPWRDLQDPRRRLLWEESYDGSTIVLLGDSALTSSFVDSRKETIWERLSALEHTGVFPGALDAAHQEDIVLGAGWVASEWPAGTTVFIGVLASKLLLFRSESSPSLYKSLLKRKVRPDRDLTPRNMSKGALPEEWLAYLATRPFFMLRNSEAVAVLLARASGGSGRSPDRKAPRVWSEGEDFARNRLQQFEATVDIDPSRASLDWIHAAATSLRNQRLHPVVVLMPFAREIPHAYLLRPQANRVISGIESVRGRARSVLAASGTPVVDLSNSVPSECFVDFFHTNVCGDRIIAERLHEWLRSQAARASSRGLMEGPEARATAVRPVAGIWRPLD